MSISLLPIYSFFHKEEVHLRAPIISLKKGGLSVRTFRIPHYPPKKGGLFIRSSLFKFFFVCKIRILDTVYIIHWEATEPVSLFSIHIMDYLFGILVMEM